MVRQGSTVLVAVLASTSVLAPALADPLATTPSWTSDDRLAPGIYPAAPVPEGFGAAEPGAAPFDIDWSVGLRGTLTKATSGDSFVTTLTPRASLARQSATLNAAVEASADIAKPLNGEVTLSRLDLSISGSRALDSLTTLKGNAALNINRQLSGSPGLDPVIIDPPSIVGGTFGLGLDREFGRFNVGLAGSATRTVYGATNRSDTGVTDNSDQNLWSTDATLRVGYQVTPIFEVFGQGGIGRDMFDNPSRSLGVRTDATDQTLRGGITGTWGNVLTATASVGVGRRDFDAAGIADVTTQLYDASVTFSPDETLRLTGALSSAITPPGPDTVGAARIENTATAKIDYTVNSWLRLRASAEVGRSQITDTGVTETKRGLGAGADYALGRNTLISADYGYSQRENSSTGTSDSHTVSLGITLKR